MQPQDNTPQTPTPVPVHTPDMTSQYTAPAQNILTGKKSYLTALILSLLLGGLGVDRFYLGKVGTGVLKLVTAGGFGIWYWVDLLRIYMNKLRPKDGTEYVDYPRHKKVGTILLSVFVVLSVLGLGGGALGASILMSRVDDLDTSETVTTNSQNSQDESLNESSPLVAGWQYTDEEIAIVEAFVAKYNNAAFSRKECGGLAVTMYDVHIEDYQIVLRFRCQGYIVNGLAIFEQSAASDEDWEQRMSQSNENQGGVPEWVYNRNPTFYDTVYNVNR